MCGRWRDICQGIDVDLGTAAAFRTQWLSEAKEQPASPTSPPHKPIPLLLRTDQAPGDAVAMTAAIYSLHIAHPGRHLTAIESLHPEVFEWNPDVVPWSAIVGIPHQQLHMHYPAISQSNDRGIHFMGGWCEFLGTALGIQVPLLTNRPHIYFSPGPTPPPEDYWLICSGGKNDFTAKLWGQHNYQEVVDRLKGQVRFTQVGSERDTHPLLTGTKNMVGKTNLRQLFELARKAKGVLCGVSLLMHVAAALEKPAIVIAGGREPVQWNSYPKQHYLHTVGMLPCQDTMGHTGQACWRSRVVPLGDNSPMDRDTCTYPVNATPTKLSKCILPKCMTLIRPSLVADLVVSYNTACK